MAGKNVCRCCGKAVTKSAHALQCFPCKAWVHVGCGSLVEKDYVFMKERAKVGFRWFCDACQVGPGVGTSAAINEDAVAGKVESCVSRCLESFKDSVLGRLTILESRVGSSISPPQFSDILKRTLEENSQKSESKPGVVISSQGKTKTVLPQQVLVVGPKKGMADQASAKVEEADMREALKEIPVDTCRKSRNGGFVIKFPSKDTKEKACAAISTYLDNDSVTVSEPKKLTPKMTIVGLPPSFPDDDVVQSIVDKSSAIRGLLAKGGILELCFTKVKGDSKSAVVRMSPEIRSLVMKNNGRMYVGLNSCRVFDRFWVTQCYHCQRFGHISSRCSKKSEAPTCAFCAERHESRACTKKSSPCCSNCSAIEDEPVSVGHYASSTDCPVMMAQRQRAIENTDLHHD